MTSVSAVGLLLVLSAGPPGEWVPHRSSSQKVAAAAPADAAPSDVSFGVAARAADATKTEWVRRASASGRGSSGVDGASFAKPAAAKSAASEGDTELFAGIPHFTVYRAGLLFDPVIRGQSPGSTPYEETPPPAAAPPYAPSPYQPGAILPQYQPPPGLVDPFAAPPILGIPGLTAPVGPGPSGFGANGPQPFRMGWSSKLEVGFLPKERTEGGLGQFSVFELDTELRYTSPLTYEWVLSMAPQFGLRTWEGPVAKSSFFGTPPFVGLPGNVFRVGLDLSLETPANAPWSVKLDFNPSINSDFEQNISRKAVNLDGYGMLMYRADPQWLLVLGAGFWDRVEDRVIPYAGVVFTPDDVWELRLLFPKARITAFLGNLNGVSHWIYLSGEYHIESYQVDVTSRGLMRMTSTMQEQVEIEDWRLLLGIKTEANGLTSFLEGGWVFGRDVDFANGTPGFDISTGFILRGGLRF